MRDGRCPKCQHNRVLHVREVADSTGRHSTPTVGTSLPVEATGYFNPLRIARIENPGAGFFDVPDAAAGVVEAFVCRACGFTELYTRGADQIPIDGTLVREIVGPEPEGPYR